MPYPELLILRHGQTEWNRAGRLQGALDSPLTGLGRAQARRQNAILREFGADRWQWYSSPQGRAHDTARIAAEGLSVSIRKDARLREIGLGAWAGRLRDEIAAQQPHLFETDGLGWYDHVPDGEGLSALERRVTAFLTEMPGAGVIVTHGITSRVIRCVAQGLPSAAFDMLGGGQGVVYHIRDGVSRMLS